MALPSAYEYLKKLMDERGTTLIDGVIRAVNGALVDVKVAGSSRTLRGVPLSEHVYTDRLIPGAPCSLGLHQTQPFVVAIHLPPSSEDPSSVAAVSSRTGATIPRPSLQVSLDGSVYQLNWTIKNPTKYRYEVYANDSDDGLTITQIAFTNYGVLETTYSGSLSWFAVRAVQADGQRGPLSAWVTVPIPFIELPGQPQNLVVNRLKLGWQVEWDDASSGPQPLYWEISKATDGSGTGDTVVDYVEPDESGSYTYLAPDSDTYTHYKVVGVVPDWSAYSSDYLEGTPTDWTTDTTVPDMEYYVPSEVDPNGIHIMWKYESGGVDWIDHIEYVRIWAINPNTFDYDLIATIPSQATDYYASWDLVDNRWDTFYLAYVDYAGNESENRQPTVEYEHTTIQLDSGGNLYIDEFGPEYYVSVVPYDSNPDTVVNIQTDDMEAGAKVAITGHDTYLITLDHGGGNLVLLGGADLNLVDPDQRVYFVFDGTYWRQFAIGSSSVGGGLKAALVSSEGGDYATLEDALDASETDIIIDEGSYVVNGETIPRGTVVRGQGPDKTILTNSASAATLYIQEGAVVSDLTIENTYASAAAAVEIPYWVTYSDWVEMYNVKIVTTQNSSDGIITDSETRLYDCEIDAHGYAVDVQDDGNVEIFGGSYKGTTTDINTVSGAEVHFNNLPLLSNGTVAGAGSFYGWYGSAAGKIYAYGSPGINVQELASDPSTPSTGRWEIYAKSGGIYVIDDAGTVIGPLGTGGGAPTDHTYLGLDTDATLTDERVFTPGDNLTGSDGGAGGAYTLNLDDVLIQTEQGSDPSTPSSGDWGLYFKSGGLYVIDDAAAVTGPLGTGGGGGAWPDDGKLMIGSTEYSTVAAAIAAASSGDLIKVGEGTFTCDNQTLPDGVDMLGSGKDVTILQTSAQATCLTVGNGCHVSNLSVENTYVSNQAYAIYMSGGDTAEFLNVRAVVDPASGSYNSSAWFITGDTLLTNCEGVTDSGGYGYALNGSGTGTRRVVGGYYDGSGSSGGDDVNNQSGATILEEPVLENGNVDTLLSGSGTAGWYLDTSGVKCSVSDNPVAKMAGVSFLFGKIADSITRTVGSGKDHATIQDAVDWFVDSGANLRDCIIDVDPGTYAESVTISGHQAQWTDGLTIQGDTRGLAGMSWVDGAVCNGAGRTNGGTGTVSLSNSGNDITVAMSTTNPSFSADGWGNGDIITVRTNAGSTSGYTISSVSGNVITLTTTAPAVGNDGTAIVLRPNVSINPSSGGAVILNGGYATVQGVRAYGAGGSAGFQSTNNGVLSLQNSVVQNFYYGAFASLTGVMQASSTTSAWQNTIGYFAYANSALYAPYAVAVSNTYGFQASRFGDMEITYAVTGAGHTYCFWAEFHAQLYAPYTYARQNGAGTGFFAAYNATLVSVGASINCATSHNPALTGGLGISATHGVIYG